MSLNTTYSQSPNLHPWSSPISNLPPLEATLLTNLAKIPSSTLVLSRISSPSTIDSTSTKSGWHNRLRNADPNVDSPFMGPHGMSVHLGRLSRVRLLTGPKARFPVVAVHFSGISKSFTFLPGESIAIWVGNRDSIVTSLLTRLNVSGSDLVHALHISSPRDWILAPPTKENPITLHDLFKYGVTLNGMVKKKVLRLLAEACTDQRDKQYLLFLCSRQGTAAFHELNQRTTNLLQLLSTFPSCMPSVESLLEHLEPLKPRCYTMIHPSPLSTKISNGAFDDDSLEIAFKVELPTTSSNGDFYEGLVTSQLYELCGSPKEQLSSARPVLLTSATKDNTYNLEIPLALETRRTAMNVFALTKERMEDTSRPILMICNGVGLAPFICMLDSISTCSKRRQVWLIHGRRTLHDDELFGRELATFIDSGVLSRYTKCISSNIGMEDDNNSNKDVITGRVDVALRTMSNEIGVFLRQEALILLCGSTSMVRDAQRLIGEAAVNTGICDNGVSFIAQMMTNGKMATSQG